ncbi:MAG: hypothetical protein LAT83_06335 [Kiritimatiellae bacterium]|nr:hypothetical protein [Kiritimatiellia bacterium]
MSTLWQQLHFFTAAYMTGVIWFVQRVEYPLLSHAQGADPAASHREYTRRMGPVGGPMMLAEMGLQLYWIANERTALSLATGFLLALIWISTFALQVPAHEKLCQGYDAEIHRRLVRGNWIRTLSWTTRAGLLLIHFFYFD